MKHPKILAEIERTQWAITTEALQGILRAVEKELTAEDYNFFHALDKTKKEALVSDLGERLPDTRHAHKSGQTGILFIDGPIVPRASAITDASGLASIEGLTMDFQALENDPEIHRIVLLLDSPGGSVGGISDFANLIKMSSKLTTAFVFGQALSAAFWIATGADEIVSVDTGIVGSIGIVTIPGQDEDGKRKFISSQSPLKHAGVESKAAKDSHQRVADDLADVFIGAVADNRSVDISTVITDFGQGAPVVARRALAAGMIDSIQTFDSLLKGKPGLSQAARQSINIPAIAGTQEGSTMLKTLKEVLAENPAIVAEVDALKEGARAEGFEAGKTQAAGRVEAATPYLKPDSVYGAAGSNLALQVLAGKCEAIALQTFAAAMDAHSEGIAQAQAQAETEGQGETPATPPAATGDQAETVASEADFRAKIDADRKRRGLSARYNVEVH